MPTSNLNPQITPNWGSTNMFSFGSSEHSLPIKLTEVLKNKIDELYKITTSKKFSLNVTENSLKISLALTKTSNQKPKTATTGVASGTSTITLTMSGTPDSIYLQFYKDKVEIQNYLNGLSFHYTVEDKDGYFFNKYKSSLCEVFDKMSAELLITHIDQLYNETELKREIDLDKIFNDK